MDKEYIDSEHVRVVSSLGVLKALNATGRKGEPGEIIYIQDTQETYIITEDGELVLLSTVMTPNTQGGLNLPLYEVNKSIIIQLPNMDSEDLNSVKENINAWRDETFNGFYMLYGKEISYFTVFSAHSAEYDVMTLGDGVIECLMSIGDIKSIDRVPDNGAFEIWVATPEGEATCLYLFPYDNGIVRMAI